MDFTDYNGLKSAIAEFLNRDDLTAQIPGFIQLAEARIRRTVRRKTVRNDAFSISTEATAVPADCQELRSLSPLTGSPSRDRGLKNATPSMLADMRAATAGVGGNPVMFAVIDGNIVVAPPPNQAYTYRAVYFQKLVPLSGSNTTNVVLTEAPDIYLYGALCESAPYLEHDERIPVWDGRFSSAVDELNAAREREETAANLHAARLPVTF
jgi:hypothetical protein